MSLLLSSVRRGPRAPLIVVRRGAALASLPHPAPAPPAPRRSGGRSSHNARRPQQRRAFSVHQDNSYLPLTIVKGEHGERVPLRNPPQDKLGLTAARLIEQEKIRKTGDGMVYYFEGVNSYYLVSWSIFYGGLALIFGSCIYYTGRISDSRRALARFATPLRPELSKAALPIDLVVGSLILGAVLVSALRGSIVNSVLSGGLVVPYVGIRHAWLNWEESYYSDQRLAMLYPGVDFSSLARFHKNDVFEEPEPFPVIVMPDEEATPAVGHTPSAQANELLRQYGVQKGDGSTVLYEMAAPERNVPRGSMRPEFWPEEEKKKIPFLSDPHKVRRVENTF